MSVRVLSAVFERSQAELGARLVLLALADSAHDDGISWMNQATLAAKARLSESQVRRTIKTLVELGELRVEKTRNGRRNVNVYRVLLADREPDLERMPQHIAALFSPAQSARVKNPVTRASCDVSPAHPERSASDAPPVGNRKGPAQEELSDEEIAAAPPRVVEVEGRNLALDALAEECGLTASDPAYGGAIVALNGPKSTSKTDPQIGIRHLAWQEVVALARDRGEVEKLRDLHDPEHGGPVRWQELLVWMIRRKVARYREQMPAGVIVTPKGLRDWWLRLERMDELRGGGRGLSQAVLDNIGPGPGRDHFNG